MIIYYLNREKTRKEVIREWASLEDYSEAYYNDLKFEIIRVGDKSFKEVLLKAPHSTTIVVSNVLDIRSTAADMKKILLARASQGIKVRLLDPDFLLDPAERSFEPLLRMMSLMEKKIYFNERSTFGKDPLPVELVDKIQYDKKMGMKIRDIALKHDVATSTVQKYTKHIPGIIKEKNKPVMTREGGKTFDLLKIKKHPLLKGKRIAEIIKEFITNQRSYHTQTTYFKDIIAFFEWAAENGHEIENEDDFTITQGHEYFSYLRKTSLSDHSVNRRFITVRTVLAYCLKRGYVKVNEFSTIKTLIIDNSIVRTPPMTEKNLSIFLSKAVELALDKSLTPDRRMFNHRNYIGFKILAATGCRLGALMNLRKKHLYTDKSGTMFILFDSKGQKNIKVSLDSDTTKSIRYYLQTYFAINNEDSFIIFSDPLTKSSMSYQGFANVIRRHSFKAGLKKMVSAHSFRSTFATLASQYLSERDVQRKLGHKSIDQTRAYIKSFSLEEEPENSWMKHDNSEELQ